MKEVILKIAKVVSWIAGIVVAIILILVILSSWNLIGFFQPFVISSGSMEPTIGTGDVVIVSNRTDAYNVGDVITYTMPSNPSTYVTHRIDEIGEAGGETVYTTKGDANDTVDQDYIRNTHVRGKVIFTIPFIGYAINFAKSQFGFTLLVIIPAVIIIYNEILNIKKELTEE